MQVNHDFQIDAAHPAASDLRVLLLSTEAAPALTKRIANLGGQVDHQQELDPALASLLEGAARYGLIVMDCDSFPTAEDTTAAVQRLRTAQSGVPTILISKAYQSQVFPQDRDEPVCLRAPLSALSLRVGVEHALRDRLLRDAA